MRPVFRFFIAAIPLAPAAWSQTPALHQFPTEIRPVLQAHCFKCHGGEQTKADLNLAQFEKTSEVLRQVKIWRKVREQIETGEMPPEGKPQPTAAEKTKVVAWLKFMIAALETGSVGRDPGRVTARRLNRTEYNNTVQDLFGIRLRPADAFPADGSGGAGFDNNADTLVLPPVLMEKYYDAAGQIVEAIFSSEALRNRLITVRPEKDKPADPAAKAVVTTWVSRIFRRKAEDAEIEKYLGVWKKITQGGAPFDDGIRGAVKAMLLSPHFLFRIEQDRPGAAPWQIDQFELAARLSYFLWSSTPDLELLATAAKGELGKPEVYTAHVRRLLKDPRSKTFSREFSSQWLGFDRLRTTVNPDKNRFPEFTQSLRVAMYRETTEFFHSIVQENQSLLRLIDADYTFLNAELARHYGLPGPAGEELQRVVLKDPNRGGLLGMGSVLTATSLPLRTSPVLRGKWVLDELLGTPPPPPPQNAGQLPADDRNAAGLTFRQQLEQHRKAANCSGCHAKLDPIGFGLENFDPVGRWRTQVAGKPVDSMGKLTTGEEFRTPAELKKILLGSRDLIIRNLVERCLAYSLGRGLEFFDEPTVAEITRKLLATDCRAETLILEITRSYPFQYRRTDPVVRVD